jgi:hypothetical protein
MGWLEETRRFLTFYLLLRNYALLAITFAASSLITWLVLSYYNQQQAPADTALPNANATFTPAAASTTQIPPAGYPANGNMQLEPPVSYIRIVKETPPPGQRPVNAMSQQMAHSERITNLRFTELEIPKSDWWYWNEGVLCTGEPFKEHPLDFTEGFVFEFDCGHLGVLFHAYDPAGHNRQPGEWFEFCLPFTDRCHACGETARAARRKQ